jgi:hypothetical protein
MKNHQPSAQVSSNNTHRQVSGKRRLDSPTTLPWPIEMLPPDSLQSAPRNARTHSKTQIRQIANSIARLAA